MMKRKQRAILIAAMLLFFTLALANSLQTPLFEAPDELQHVQYVRHLINQKTLPIQDPNGTITQSHQPPLYYLGGAILLASMNNSPFEPTRNPFWAATKAYEVSRDNKLQFINDVQNGWPYRGTAVFVHSLRVWSLLLALGGVIGIWAIGQHLWPDEPAKVTLILAIAAFNPMLLYMAGTVNNDNLIFLLGTLILYFSLQAVRHDFNWKATILLGILTGLALLSKLNGIVLFATWGVALLWVGWQKRDVWFVVMRGLIIGGITAVIAAWWFIRNARIYGDPLAMQINLDIWGERTAKQTTLAHFWADTQNGWTNFWGRFGYGQIPLPDLIYTFYFLLCLTAAIGAILLITHWLLPPLRLRASALNHFQSRQPINPDWLIITITFLGYLAAFYYYVFRSPTGANGRYLYPSLAAIAALFILTISQLLSSVKKQNLIYISLTTILIGIAIYSTLFYLPWVYAAPPQISHEQVVAQIDDHSPINWDNEFLLLGTAVSPPEATAGQPITITTCWQVQRDITENYVIYLRLLSPQQTSLGQRDTLPGLGTFPTINWNAGDLFCEEYPITVTDDVPSPLVGHIDIGFYKLSTADSLPAYTEDGSPLDRVVVEQIKVNPVTAVSPPTPQTPTNAQFAQNISLIGYSWQADESKVNATTTVQLFWHANGPLDDSYTIFTHLHAANQTLLAQDDKLPQNGAYPTNYWGNDEIIITEHQFNLPADSPAGATQLQVGFYRLSDGIRLPRINAEQADYVEINGPNIIR